MCTKLISWLMICSLAFAGCPAAAASAATTCDTSNFAGFFLEPDGLTTAAVTIQPLTWSAAAAAAKAGGGRLAVITGSAQNTAIFSNLSSQFTASPEPTSTPEKKAWIDLVDPLNSPDWSIQGGPQMVVPSRFSWADDSSSWSNWATGQPDGYCTTAEQAVQQDHNCYGEPWAVINTDGTWSDEGDHGNTPTIFKGVVEWPGTTLDCVKSSTPATPPDVEPLPGAATGELWCTNSSQSNLVQCVATTDGQQICPLEQSLCNASQASPICPATSTLNTTRGMCQATPAVVCPIGYTWSASIDECTTSVTCTSGGTYNPVTNQCEMVLSNECPTGFTYDSTRNVCSMPVNCNGGVFNAASQSCTATPVWDCQTGYTYNTSTARCEVAPYCPPGTNYNNATNRCESALGSCPTGYSYSSALDQCVAAVTCNGGGLLNGSTGQCELSTLASCPSGGWNYNSTTNRCEQPPTCSAPGTYSAADDVCLTGTIATTCPTNYSYSFVSGTCIESPICLGGTYSTANGRCEASTTNSCSDPTYTYNSSSARCEKTPICPSGMTYNTTYSVCMQVMSPTCSAGYTYNSSRARCEESPPECTSGSTYNPATNKCESTATSAATGGYSCDSGDTLSGTICTLITAYSSVPYCVSDSTYVNSAVYNPVLHVNNFPPQGFGMNGASCEAAFGSTSISQYQFMGTHYYEQCGTCYGTCPSGGTLSGNTCTVTSNYSATMGYSCPSGGTLSGTTCTTVTQTNPTCTGGSFDATNEVCWSAYTPSCAQGAYDSAIGQCTVAPTCSNGLLDSSSNLCFQAASAGCPGGYSISGGVCIASPSCDTGGIYASSANECTAPAANSCPSGYSYSAPYGQCYQTANCNGGGLDTTLNVCAIAYSSTCPSGYSLNGSTCQLAPTCATPGTYNAGINLCDAGNNVCTSPLVLDPSANVCYQASSCGPGGTLDSVKNVCYASATPDCSSIPGYSWNSTTGVCTTAPICGLGAFNATANDCEASITVDCGSYTWNQASNKCIQAITCPGDPSFSLNSTVKYDGTLDLCVSQTVHNCVAGTTYNGLPVEQCEAVPICAAGATFNSQNNSCVGSYSCPTGPSACHQIAGDTTMNPPGIPAQYCSPDTCQSNTAGMSTTTDTDAGLNDKTNTGAHAADGSCLGQIYLYNGTDSRCRVYDIGGMIDSYAKLVGSIVLSCTGLGAALAGALIADGAITAGALASTIATLANTAAQLTLNAALDAATNQQSSVTLISAATTLVGQGLATYIAAPPATSGTVIANGISTNLVYNSMGDVIGTTVNSGAFFQPLTALTTAGANMVANASFQTFMAGIQGLANTAAPVIATGMLGSYEETKCCVPDQLSASCVSTEIQEASQQLNGMCHIIGSYCASTVLMACTVEKQTSCCFNSLLARVFQEQGRPLLASFGPDGAWGTPLSPNCRGFTPEEFQNLDFNAMDLTDYTNSIETKMGNIAPMLTTYMNSVGAAKNTQLSIPTTGVTPP